MTTELWELAIEGLITFGVGVRSIALIAIGVWVLKIFWKDG